MVAKTNREIRSPASLIAAHVRSRSTATGRHPGMAKIRVGLAGCGFVAELHMHAYRRVYGVDVEVRAVAAPGDHVVEFARRHHIRAAYRSFPDTVAQRAT